MNEATYEFTKEPINNVMKKDYFSVLGLSRGASKDDLRKAYLSRSRVVHPDRFSKHDQPDDWRLANEMLRELNEAYAHLKDNINKYQDKNNDACAPDISEFQASVNDSKNVRHAGHFVFDSLSREEISRIKARIFDDKIYWARTKETFCQDNPLKVVSVCIMSMLGFFLWHVYVGKLNFLFLISAALLVFVLLWRCMYLYFRILGLGIFPGAYVSVSYFIISSIYELKYCPVEKILKIEVEHARRREDRHCFRGWFRVDGVNFNFCLRRSADHETLLRRINDARKAVVDNYEPERLVLFSEEDVFVKVSAKDMAKGPAPFLRELLLSLVVALVVTLMFLLLMLY